MTISKQEFDNFSNLILEKSAIVLEPGKEYLVENRLAPLIKQEGLSGLSDLFKQVQRNSKLLTQVVDAITTNETLFFRDIHPFSILKAQVLPDLIEKRRDRKELHIWSAACSSGQEAYSIAITIKEAFPHLRDWKFKILCTDISNAMLERTKQGVFSQLEVNRGMPASLLVKYFKQKGTDWEVNEELRSWMEVRHLNLADSWGHIDMMDIIFIRNVLIYFDVKMREQILSKMRKVIASDGYLFLGATETILSFESDFETRVHDKTIMYVPKTKVGNLEKP